MKIDKVVREILDALARRHNVLLYGPPGTGKTYLMSIVRSTFSGPMTVVLDEDAETDFLQELRLTDRPCREAWWITFHQSYSYEDFVVGLRTQAAAGFHLVPRQGPLLEAAENARLPDGASLILIDEINRGNTSRIFGEFITLMESSKRLDSQGNPHSETISIQLPHIPIAGLPFDLVRRCEGHPRTVQVVNPFTMPWHIHTLASMNSVDKTVAPLDAAIRRRFHIIELQPDYELLIELFQLTGTLDDYAQLQSDPNNIVYWRKVAVKLLYQINYRIRSLVGDDFQLGHSYLIPLASISTVPEFKRALKTVLESNIVPQLRETLRSDTEVLGTALAAAEPDADTWYPYRFERVPSELGDMGRRPLKLEQIPCDAIERVVLKLAAIQTAP